jgi:hypothetical protein
MIKEHYLYVWDVTRKPLLHTISKSNKHNNREQDDWGTAQAIAGLPTMQQAMGSIPITIKSNKTLLFYFISKWLHTSSYKQWEFELLWGLHHLVLIVYFCSLFLFFSL